jgi:peptide/nickel transport system permease protein
MLNYFIRRCVYGALVLLGVNLVTFMLFFTVNTPDDMARLNIGGKRVTQEQILKWKVERGYDKPLYWNGASEGTHKATDTVFWDRSVSLFALDFGRSDSTSATDIGHEIGHRMLVSLQLAVPIFVLQVVVSVAFALLLVFFKNSPIDFWGVVTCVLMLSISALFYIIVGQFLFSRVFHLVPISGFESGLDAARFLILPVILSLLSRLGSEGRLYRAMFLEELGRDYVRTARAKGASSFRVVAIHALRNALIPVVTTVGLQVGTLLAGAILTETIFSWPGIGKWIVEAIGRRDHPAVQGGLLMSASVIIGVNLLVDLMYGVINPRIRHHG